MRSKAEWLAEAYRHASSLSSDLNTHNGAIIVSVDGLFVKGVNRLPDGVRVVPQRLEKDRKATWIEHAERDAIYAAARHGVKTAGGVMYCPWFACPDCARAIIQAGIVEVVGHAKPDSMTPERWREPVRIARGMLSEASVRQTIICDTLGVSVLFDGKIIQV